MSRYIDADALENRIKAEWAKREDDKGYGLAQFFVKTQPTADVAPAVHGHWMTMPNYEYSIVPFKCSACYYRFSYRSKFCPECGAKMDEEKNK